MGACVAIQGAKLARMAPGDRGALGLVCCSGAREAPPCALCLTSARERPPPAPIGRRQGLLRKCKIP